MIDFISVMLAGVQGEGFVSTGNLLIKALSRSGYYTYGIRTFSSRIKGGSSSYTIDISQEKVLCSSDQPSILVAFDENSIKLHQNKLESGGLLLYDDTISPKVINSNNFNSMALPFTTIAQKHGTKIMKNTTVIGILSKLLDIPFDNVKGSLASTFSKKGKKVLQANLSILEEAFDIDITSNRYYLKSQKRIIPRPSMIGNEAIALGALSAGCRFMSAYPITPASEIMEYLSKKFPQYNGIVVQTEDEISALTMSLGASYAGCRSMTATSGPGISLMMEGVGLAGMTETPVVIVDSQRGGPSTGLPTKTEQSDILSVYDGPHGDIPSIILAPYSVETCFYFAIEAFNLADVYQCPVFILTDLTLGLSRQTIDSLNKDQIVIDRGNLYSQSPQDKEIFNRFSFTENGISPRFIPGDPDGIHHVTGIEHDHHGKPSENPTNRVKMVDKRLRKTKPLEKESGIDLFGDTDSSLLVLGIGSTYGVVKRIVEENDLNIAYGMVKRIKPLPLSQLQLLLETYEKVLVIENNATGQLSSLIKREFNQHDKINNLLKYDGTPFTMAEIKRKIEELI